MNSATWSHASGSDFGLRRFILYFVNLRHTLPHPRSDPHKTRWMRLSTGQRIAWPLHPTWSRRLLWHSALLTTQEEANKTKHMKIGLDVLKQDKSQTKVLGTQPIYASLSRNPSSLAGDASGNPGNPAVSGHESLRISCAAEILSGSEVFSTLTVHVFVHETNKANIQQQASISQYKSETTYCKVTSSGYNCPAPWPSWSYRYTSNIDCHKL